VNKTLTLNKIKVKEMEEITSNVNHTETLDDDSLEAIVSVVVPILFSLIGVVGFIGNSLVIITVLCNQQMRNTTNLLILNLSLADLLFVCFCIPATVSFIYCRNHLRNIN
jgi:allatostatin A receptor